MLGIQKLTSLAEIVGIDVGKLRLIAEFANRDVTEWTAWDPTKKPRPVIKVVGDLRNVQQRLYDRRLKQRLHPSRHSYGGVSGRHIIANASEHIGHRFVYKTDISNFYPSITIDRVNRLFLRQLGCSYEVSRFLTRFCTYDFHLALGLITSPILADQILRTVDLRMSELCSQYNLTLTRFVDDITISGNFDIENSAVPQKLWQILKSHGFQMKFEKSGGGYVENGLTITGLQIRCGRVDVTRAYLDELDRQLIDHASLASGGRFEGPFFSESQLAGCVNYISWVNRNRRFGLIRKLRAIRWSDVWREATRRGLVQARKALRRRGEPGPCFAKCFGSVITPGEINSHAAEPCGIAVDHNEEPPF